MEREAVDVDLRCKVLIKTDIVTLCAKYEKFCGI